MFAASPGLDYRDIVYQLEKISVAQMSPDRKLQLLLKYAHYLNKRQISQSLANTPDLISETLLRAQTFEQLDD